MSDLVETYKETMSYWPSGVAIVTSELDGHEYGMTVSSFTSVSLHPAMISLCIDKKAQMCELLQKSKKLAVSILDHSQVALAEIFADHHLKMEQRFKQAQFNRHDTQSPVLSKCLGWLDCRVHSMHDTGDHVIYVGEVLQAKAFGAGDPVIFYRRGWHQVSEI